MAKMPAQHTRGEAQTPAGVVTTLGRSGATTATPRRGSEIPPEIRGPASGRMLSSFTLPDANGRAVSIWSYRQRSNLVVFFHHGTTCSECRDVLQELSSQAAAFRDEEAAVLAVGPDRRRDLRDLAKALACPFPLLSDPSGGAVARQGLGVPSLVVTDRFGEIWAAWTGKRRHALPGGPEIRRWLELVELQCPECGVAEWPPLPSGVIMD